MATFDLIKLAQFTSNEQFVSRVDMTNENRSDGNHYIRISIDVDKITIGEFKRFTRALYEEFKPIELVTTLETGLIRMR